MAEKYYTVSGLTMLIGSVVESTPSLHGIWVRGELSGFSHHSSGHMYFTLKDAGARLRCVMFRNQNKNLRFKPLDGLEVFAFGSISVFERNGDYQLYVENIEPAGLGTLHLAFVQLRDRLAKEGLFDEARKRPLPAHPSLIGLVTSPTGAAVRDMIKILRQRQRGIDILVIPVLVQGSEAAQAIADGLAVASSLELLDLVIVGRGGGSPEELWSFNEEIVARAIASCRHPVISAVGHEIDVTIADFVADARAATPSAAAEMAVPDGRMQLKTIAQLARRLAAAQRRHLLTCRASVARTNARLNMLSPARMLLRRKQELDQVYQEMLRSIRLRLAGAREDLAMPVARLQALSPLAVLSRGYAICRGTDGKIVRRAEQVETGGKVDVHLGQGRLHCLVQQKEDHDARD